MNDIPLKFGIETLDDLISPGSLTTASSAGDGQVWTAAIQGPDGCGKSILGLHLASHYWLNHPSGENTPSPSIVYISTDLSFFQAQMQWKAFGLDQPTRRAVRLEAWYGLREDRESQSTDAKDSEVELRRLDPVADKTPETETSIEDFVKELENPTVLTGKSISFVDLQASTAGDDWGWINQFVSFLPDRKQEGTPKHLLIIDAVEGLEMMVGDRDAYGNRRSRRSRIAQLIRNATRRGVHVVFVVEEPHKNSRMPEQFVADLVIRVRQHLQSDYSQRTIEVEKCRAIAHVRGEHELSIRTGVGAFTGNKKHLDNPQIVWTDRDRNGQWLAADAIEYLAHIHITRSLHRRNREFKEEKVDVPSSRGKPTFGLRDLDSCFQGSVEGGSLAFLLGEAGTHKGQLGRRFLANSIKWDTTTGALASDASGIVILISSRLIDRDRLIDAMFSHWPDAVVRAHKLQLEAIRNDPIKSADEKQQSTMAFKSEFLRDRVFCQRLGSRRLSSAPLGEIISTYVHHAQQLLLNWKGAPGQEESLFDIMKKPLAFRRDVGPKIRVVIEDWNALLTSHRELQNDRELLQSVVTLLRREQVNALIISTQPAQPSFPVQLSSVLPDLRTVDETQIWTWPVAFYGQRRTALTVASGSKEPEGPAIYELLPAAPADSDNDGLKVDPHFDIYRDVDTGRPTRVPLLVRLYTGNHYSDETQVNTLRFAKLLQDTLSQVFAAPEPTQAVVQFDTHDCYDRFFAFATELHTARLDHSLILQIDEFWSEEHKSFANLETFWKADEVIAANGVVDPPALSNRILYYPHSDTEEAFRTRRIPTKEFLDLLKTKQGDADEAVDEADEDGNYKDEPKRRVPIPSITSRPSYQKSQHRSDFFIEWRNPISVVDRIPYLWDFGMLVADRSLWRRYESELVPLYGGESESLRIGDIWDSLCLRRNRLRAGEAAWRAKWMIRKQAIDWPSFLAACRIISTRERIASFDVDLSTAETLSCLVFEIWASIQDQFAPNSRSGCSWLKQHGDDIQKIHGRSYSLRDYASAFPHSLYVALAHFIGTCDHLKSTNRIVSRHHVSGCSAASRHWYHTASALAKGGDPEASTLLQLPGTWSTRGDWALAVAAGSRSKRLAHAAIDMLSSRRMNLLRLQDGMGLPVRDILPDSQIGELPSAFSAEDVDLKKATPIRYGELCYLGANPDNEDFHWLWRSRIKHFDRDSFYFRSWIARVIEERDWIPPHFLEGTFAMDTASAWQAFDWQEFTEKNWKPTIGDTLHESFRNAVGKQFADRFYDLYRVLLSALR